MELGFLGLLLVLLFSPTTMRLDSLSQPQFIVWNIGQGQWTTLVTDSECQHFDVGGEFNVTTRVEKLCAQKLNRIFLSHWDWDHVGLLDKLKKSRLALCLAGRPLGEASKRKQDLLQNLATCHIGASAQIIYKPQTSPSDLRRGARRGANHLSQVWWVKDALVLIPGDSTTHEEHIWAGAVPVATRGLVLGHHGSRTSTSPVLLSHTKHLKWAVSSARHHRYGHPHQQVVDELKRNKIPLLRTEDWGHLHFEI